MKAFYGKLNHLVSAIFWGIPQLALTVSVFLISCSGDIPPQTSATDSTGSSGSDSVSTHGTGMTEDPETGSSSTTDSVTTGSTTTSESTSTTDSVTTSPTTTSESTCTTEASTTTSETTEDDTTGQDTDCQDPNIPACSACQAMDVPERLFGLTWNFATGVPGSEGSQEELRCILSKTGSSDLIGAIPGMDWLPAGSNAHHREAMVLYAVAFANADQIKRIFSIDTLTGELLYTPPAVGQDYNWSGGLHVRSDDVLIGLTWNPEAIQEELYQIDPLTGSLSLLAPVNEIKSLVLAMNTYDGANDVILLIGKTMGDDFPHLFKVDGMSGLLLDMPPLSSDYSWNGVLHLTENSLVAIDGEGELLLIDPETAGITSVFQLPLGPILPDGSVYDPETDQIILVDGDNVIHQINPNSGEIITSSILEKPNPDYAYNWSGGLHIR